MPWCLAGEETDGDQGHGCYAYGSEPGTSEPKPVYMPNNYHCLCIDNPSKHRWAR